MWLTYGTEDIGAELRLLNERMDRQDRTLTRIERKQDYLMGLVSIEQGDLDSIATTISQVADALQAVLDSPTALAPADEAGVQDALTKLKAVGPRVPTNAPPVADPAPAPVDTPPVDTPPADVPVETPVDTPPADAPADTPPADSSPGSSTFGSV